MENDKTSKTKTSQINILTFQPFSSNLAEVSDILKEILNLKQGQILINENEDGIIVDALKVIDKMSEFVEMKKREQSTKQRQQNRFTPSV